MEYKVEPIETNFGKGGRIEKEDKSYEQYTCKDGLFARVFKAPYEENNLVVNTDYHGIIFRPSFKDSDQDYEQFKVLAERLQNASKEEIPYTKADFMDYISHSGLEKKLPRIGTNVRINLKNKQYFPDKIKSWLNSKGHLGGLVSDLAAYALGFGIITNTVPDAELTKGLVMYSIFGPFFEGVLGLPAALESKFGWCGPIHTLGFITSRIINKNKLKNPNYMLEKFLQNYQRLDAMGTSVGNQKEYAKQSKKADRHFGVLEDMFPFTEHQKGFSITYDDSNRDNVISFFDYVLEGGSIPKLSSSRTKTKKPKSEETPIETFPTPSDFINPWEVKIPKIGGKKNE